MIKYIIGIFFSFVFSVSVTFNVDMQEQFVSENGVHLAGSDALTETFFGTVLDEIAPPWTPDAITMIDDNFDGVYTITLEVDPNTSYIYKFVNGFSYELEGGLDREIDVAEEDMALSIVCYDIVDEPCIDIDNSLVEVTFTVDMQEVDLSENGVSILGANDSFSNFGYYIDTLEPIPTYEPSALSLMEIDDDIYSVSIYVNPGIDYQYKFINGNDYNW